MEKRIASYLDAKFTDTALAKTYPALANSTERYDPKATRKAILDRDHQTGRIVRYAYRPFDVRWLYWDADTKLVDEKRPEFMVNTAFENRFLTAGIRNRMGICYKPQSTSVLGDHHLVESNVSIFPARVRQDSQNIEPNVARSVKTLLTERTLTSDQLFDHVLATLNAPIYETQYMDALRVDWPRIPFPKSKDVFARSAALGAKLGNLLDVEVEIDGVRKGPLAAGLSAIALPFGDDFEVTSGWGSIQRKENGSRLVMPGAGVVMERDWSDAELEALRQIGERHDLDLTPLLDLVGHRAVDVQVNPMAGWRGVPSGVWNYTAGGYQALKKWLSYREKEVLGRSLRGEEMLHFAQTARRITEMLTMGPALDDAHRSARIDALAWPEDEKAQQLDIVIDDNEDDDQENSMIIAEDADDDGSVSQ